jgi:hypothetical protein
MERTEEEKVTGLLLISVGGAVKRMPTLKAKFVPEWGELLSTATGQSKPLSEWTDQDATLFGGAQVQVMLDLITAYDRTAALGGREWLEENADPAELHAALVQMAGNAFPLAEAATLVNLALVVLAGRFVPLSSTSGASTSGTATPTRLTRRSTRSR